MTQSIGYKENEVLWILHWDSIYNTSFSLQFTIGANKLEHNITLSKENLLRMNTLDFLTLS